MHGRAVFGPTIPDAGINDQYAPDEDHGVAAFVAAQRYGLQEYEAQICIALDVSVSMQDPNGFYDHDNALGTSSMQRVIEKVMSMAIALAAGQNPTVTIFPFGSIAHQPVIIDAQHEQEATNRVLTSIKGIFDEDTNYHVALVAIREYYFGDARPTTEPVAYYEPPVYCLFITDGDANRQQAEAAKQIKYSENNAIFFKFLALSGVDAAITAATFNTLRLICNKSQNSIPNRDLLIITDPDELAMEGLFQHYPQWLEVALRRGIIMFNPAIDFYVKNTNDAAHNAEQLFLDSRHDNDDRARHYNRVIPPSGQQPHTFFRQNANATLTLSSAPPPAMRARENNAFCRLC